jgi:REP element-mobilizing transposase RayT
LVGRGQPHRRKDQSCLIRDILNGMSNVHRLRVSDRIFFVTSNLVDGLAHFKESEYSVLLKCIDRARNRLGFLLCGYVLMPDHWHALIWCRDPLTISRVMEDLKSTSSREINQSRHRKGTLWQHQFWDRFVRGQKEFHERLEYMHYNPLRRGLAAKPEDWRWSSCSNFSMDPTVVESCPIRIDYLHLPDDYRA